MSGGTSTTFQYRKRGRKPLSPNTKRLHAEQSKEKAKAKRQEKAKALRETINSNQPLAKRKRTTTTNVNQTPKRAQVRTQLVYVHANNNHPANSPKPTPIFHSQRKPVFSDGFVPDFSKLNEPSSIFDNFITPSIVRKVTPTDCTPGETLVIPVPAPVTNDEPPAPVASKTIDWAARFEQMEQQMKATQDQLKKAQATIEQLTQNHQPNRDELVPGIQVERTQRGGYAIWYEHFRYRKIGEGKWRCDKNQDPLYKCNVMLYCVDGQVEITGAHSHLANHLAEEIQKAKYESTTRAKDPKEKRTTTSQIYNEERNKLSDDAQQIMTIRRHGVKTLNRHRNQLYPKLPVDVDDFISKMQDESLVDLEKFRKTADLKYHFYHSSIKVDHDRIVVFATEEDFYRLAVSDRWFFDGTFTAQPTNFKQLFTIHCLHPESTVSLPTLYALMTSKSSKIYGAFLTAIKETCLHALQQRQLPPELRLQTVTCDFESGFIPAIKETFGEGINFVGCLFHYTQCIFRHIQRTGLQDAYNRSTDFQQAVRNFMALAFLPVDEVQDQAEKMIEELDPLLKGFGDYFRQTWLLTLPPMLWNVHAYDIRTNNAIEGLFIL